MSEAFYVELVQWTGKQAHPEKRGKLASAQSDQSPQALWSVAKHPRQWIRQVKDTETRYYRAIGSAEASEPGQCWMKGVSGERAWLILESQTE